MGLTPRIEFTDLNAQYERHFLLHNYRLLLDDHGWQYPNRKSSFNAFFGFYIYANSFAYRQNVRKDISDLPDRVKSAAQVLIFLSALQSAPMHRASALEPLEYIFLRNSLTRPFAQQFLSMSYPWRD